LLVQINLIKPDPSTGLWPSREHAAAFRGGSSLHNKAAASVKGHAAMALGRSGSGVGGTCHGAAGNTQFDSMESEETDGIR
jgi:hypothetical protein